MFKLWRKDFETSLAIRQKITFTILSYTVWIKYIYIVQNDYQRINIVNYEALRRTDK